MAAVSVAFVCLIDWLMCFIITVRLLVVFYC